MNSLFARLTFALLLIVGALGVGFFFLARYATDNYYEELTQRLNGPIAMYVTGEHQLIRDGAVDFAALENLAHQAMIINPTVEIYLLDPQGHVIDHALEGESLAVSQVALDPIRTLLSGDQDLPIRGTDPRNGGKKVFSVAEIRSDIGVEGYLYAVLGGATHDTLAKAISESYTQKMSMAGVLVFVLIASATGILIFYSLTRRLTRLSAELRQYAESDFEARANIAVDGGRDEISKLRQDTAAMAARIQRQIQRLKANDQLRRDLVSNVSHDLRTPLASMQGYVETLLLKDEELTPRERKHYLEITRKHTRHLARLVGDLFELSKLESASVEPKLEPFSLAELLQDIVHEFELEANRKNVGMTVSADPSSALVVADLGLVQRVLENLIRNSLTHTPGGGRIWIEVAADRDRVAVAVSDTGKGIPEDEIPLIFERFYRSEDDPNSTGLGLAIVKRILDLHGSRLRVSSAINEGTRFEFELRGQEAA